MAEAHDYDYGAGRDQETRHGVGEIHRFPVMRPPSARTVDWHYRRCDYIERCFDTATPEP
ncbi:MAG: hypothetical protein ACYDD4_05915 [Acidimicrobiales bacterium]